jgi:hypothetical protein
MAVLLTLTTINRQQPPDDEMRNIFHGYHTGERNWTVEWRTFTEDEFRDLFVDVLSNKILNDASIAFMHRERLTVYRFSVPIHSELDIQRDVFFVEVPGSQYYSMQSCIYFRTSPLSQTIANCYSYETAQLGLMTEYDILDLIEPTNNRHQIALIDTWFDIDNWFDILAAHGDAHIDRLDNIVNGYDPEHQLDAVADEFVPEIAPLFQNHQGQGAVAYWNVRDLVERVEEEQWYNIPPPEFIEVVDNNRIV